MSSTHRHPIFARVYPYISRVGEQRGAAEHRRALLAGLEGKVIEVGAGHGLNFAYYPAAVTQVVAVEPEPHLRELARAAAKRAPVSIQVRAGTAEALPADDGEFDAVAASLVLCSVADQEAALHEIVRVLRPGGELRFYEHVVSKRPAMARVQRALDATIYPPLAGGCHSARDTRTAILQRRVCHRARAAHRFQTQPAHAIDPAHPRHGPTGLSSTAHVCWRGARRQATGASVERFQERNTVGDAQVFLFADLAGFTALTEAHGDEQAADLVDDFSRAAGRLLSNREGELVKTIGDALMLRLPKPAEAVKLGLALTGEILAEHGYPAVRVGMHYGPAVHRCGDWFGASVNLAARISGLAAGGEVLASEATRAATGELHGVRFQDRGSHRVRNVTTPVHVFAAVRGDAPLRATWIDPVCRMAVDPTRAAGTLIHEGVEYRFCSLRCAERFAAAPGDYSTS